MKILDLFGQEHELKSAVDKKGKKKRSYAKPTNPRIAISGSTPGEKCKNCVHFFRKQYSKTYLKCELIGNTNGPGTDIRANWEACGDFQKAQQNQEDERREP